MKIIAIVNGKARGKRNVLSDLKKITNHEIQIWVTKVAADTTAFAHDAVKNNPDLLLICGGDGTSNKVVNVLMDYNPNQRPTLAVFPAGSANDFSKSLKHVSISQTIQRFEQGKTIEVDVTLVSTSKKKGYALNMTTMGIGANVARSVTNRKGWIPPAFNFFTATLAWIVAYKPAKLQIQIGEMTIKIKPFMVAFGNGKFVGHGLGICPQAVLGDGNFAVTLMTRFGLFDYTRHIAEIRQAKLMKNDPRIIYHTARFVEIRVLEHKVGIETDGEYFQTLREDEYVRITCVQGALCFVSGSPRRELDWFRIKKTAST